MKRTLILLMMFSIQAFAVSPEAQKLLCEVHNYGVASQSGGIESATFVFMPIHKKKIVEVGNLKATVRAYDPIGDNSFRLVLHLRGRLENGEIAYASTFTDDVIPRRLSLFVAIPDSEKIIGMVQCERLD